jgi:hypothetical protein
MSQFFGSRHTDDGWWDLMENTGQESKEQLRIFAHLKDKEIGWIRLGNI